MNVNDRISAHSMSDTEFYLREVLAVREAIPVLGTRNCGSSAQTLR